MRFKTLIITSLLNYSDTYIVVKWKITVTDTNANNQINKELVFTDNVSFRSCM